MAGHRGHVTLRIQSNREIIRFRGGGGSRHVMSRVGMVGLGPEEDGRAGSGAEGRTDLSRFLKQGCGRHVRRRRRWRWKKTSACGGAEANSRVRVWTLMAKNMVKLMRASGGSTKPRGNLNS